jgi:phage portal protein BeeE
MYDINLFEQIYKKNFLQQGAQLGGILQSEVALNKDQIEEYLEQFKIRHSGPKHAGLPMVLPKMLKWTTTEPSPRDMQWAEAVNLSSSQLLQIYGISDAKLGRADIGNRNTADAMDVTFNREVIQTRVDTIVSKINTEFLPIYPQQTDQLYFSASFDDPVPGDGEMQLKKENQDMQNGIITPNEIRESRRLKPFGKYGDQIYKAINLMPVDPMAATLEISQDDADKFGFVGPEEQAALDQKTAEAQAAAKPDGEGKAGAGDAVGNGKGAAKGKSGQNGK